MCSRDLLVHRLRAKSLVSLQRALIPSWESCPCDLTKPSYPPKGPIFKYHNLGGQDSNMWILWETQAFSPHQQPWVTSSVLWTCIFVSLVQFVIEASEPHLCSGLPYCSRRLHGNIRNVTHQQASALPVLFWWEDFCSHNSFWSARNLLSSAGLKRAKLSAWIGSNLWEEIRATKPAGRSAFLGRWLQWG